MNPWHACMVQSLATAVGSCRVVKATDRSVTVEADYLPMLEMFIRAAAMRGVRMTRLPGRRVVIHGAAQIKGRKCCEDVVEKAKQYEEERRELSRPSEERDRKRDQEEARPTEVDAGHHDDGQAEPSSVLGVLGLVPRRRNQVLDQLF